MSKGLSQSRREKRKRRANESTGSKEACSRNAEEEGGVREILENRTLEGEASFGQEEKEEYLDDGW